nr:flagellar hook capping FlgD N-terminal domain-containing protein [uncultured Oscillibacter sp.]
MSGLMSDIGNLYGTQKVGNKDVTIAKKGSNTDLDMTDFISLMIVQMTNQGIDDSMDTSEMLNQMVQMQMITSMVNMTDAVTMNYAASLVGKEVTVGKLGDDGKLQEVVGVVTGTGTMDGQQVIFVNDEYYYLNEIMAVGKLPPPQEDDEEDGDKVEDAGKPGGTQKPEDTKKPEGTETPEDTKKPEGTETPSEPVQPGDGTQSAEYDGKDGAPTGSEG